MDPALTAYTSPATNGLLRLHVHRARHVDATRSQFRYGSSGSHHHDSQR